MLRRIAKIASLGVVTVFLCAIAAKEVSTRRFYDDYNAAVPLNAKASLPEPVDATDEVRGAKIHEHYRHARVTFEARPGETVPTIMNFPMEEKQAYPVIVFLHGLGMEKEFIDKISTPFNEAGFVMACFDQTMCGERTVTGNPLTLASEWRARAWKTVNDTRRLIDYLQTRPDIDPSRIYLIGASYGAITGTPTTALDRRIKAAILVVGGGDIPTLLSAPKIREIVPPVALAMLKPLIGYFLAPADPVRLAPHVAPTPVLMQNGSNDTLVTPEAAKKLFAALAEPKEIRWYPIDHPGLQEGDGPAVLHMLEDGLAWLVEQDKKHADKPGVQASNSNVLEP